ncbi:PPC domain-containing DNA-binding protein [endosymbiont GvMRE of Glomus versiforme]|uniref:PPC domain-containing DNA-binding protein n=1 Tax=endosymbiont GvMRE of Glomus versiforme TaxID=2039283 RepID=UPI000EC7D224|nr:PPC domain-containing DNA-binding protein [endosymbiont GvMRE of Glomus versiforme]RHZ37741.1 PF03479 domain protein [endosymbiont GvMRE of Glomus versiforme]
MQIKKLGNCYIIRIEPGDPFMASLEKFARDTQIGFGWVSSIGGGLKDVKYAFSVGFDTGYEPVKKNEGPLELLNGIGCIGWDHDDTSKPMIHLHGTFVDREMEKAFGGHLIEAKVVRINYWNKSRYFKPRKNYS